MATQATPTLGCKLETQVSGVWTVVAEVTSIAALGLENKTADATHIQSPGLIEEGVVVSKTGGSADFELNFLAGDSSQLALIAQVEAQPVVRCSYRVTWTDPLTKVWTFSALPAKFKARGESKGKLQATLSLEYIGAYTRT